MNGLPASIDLQPLIGKEVVQICFGCFQLILNLEGNIRIAIESICVCRLATGYEFEAHNYCQEATHLCKLMAEHVSFAHRDVDGGLVLGFTNGIELQIKNSNLEYESFQIHIGQQIHVA